VSSQRFIHRDDVSDTAYPAKNRRFFGYMGSCYNGEISHVGAYTPNMAEAMLRKYAATVVAGSAPMWLTRDDAFLSTGYMVQEIAYRYAEALTLLSRIEGKASPQCRADLAVIGHTIDVISGLTFREAFHLFELSLQAERGASGVRLRWSSLPGVACTVQSTTSLLSGDWVDIKTFTAGADEIQFDDDRLPAIAVFYRLVRRP